MIVDRLRALPTARRADLSVAAYCHAFGVRPDAIDGDSRDADGE